MDYIVFKQWLQNEKRMSIRSANDVISRCKRINRLTERDVIDDDTVAILVEMELYDEMSLYIKSQLKRAATLYMEFVNKEAK
ncbi:MAG: hypothetical protein ACI4EW_03240 [Butyrivibrio sp.]